MKGQIEALYVYPVKSCAGIALESSQLSAFGLENDRQWMIVDERGVMVTQRITSQLALIQTQLLHNKGTTQLQLSHPKHGHIDVNDSGDTTRVDVSIWKDTVSAIVADARVNDWLTRAVSSPRPLRLVRFDQAHHRQPAQVDRFGQTSKHFADAAPFLVVNKASLRKLNQTLLDKGKSPVELRAFRPNIVVSGLDAFEEHQFSTMRSDRSTLSFTLVDQCIRCVVITIDPDTGIKHPAMHPYKELAGLNPMPGKPNAAVFGVNARLDQSATPLSLQLSIGDALSFA